MLNICLNLRPCLANPRMAIFHPLQTPQNLSISSSNFLSGQTLLTLIPKFSHLSLTTTTTTRTSTIIRMGGGPRTFPGGVNKWQWKRMQAKKAKQLLKARLARERQIYEMRKRAELKAAVSELERPWEVVEKAPKLFSASADVQVQVLADRFQKPGGFDLWSEKDGPELFKTVDGFPSARYFPKGVVHSIKPYGRVNDEIEEFGGLGKALGGEKGVKVGSFDEYVEKRNLFNEGGKGKVRKKRHGRRVGGSDSRDINDGVDNGKEGMVRKDGSFRRGMHVQEGEVYDKNSRDMSNGMHSRKVGYDKRNSGRWQVVRKDGSFSKGMHLQKVKGVKSEIYDMDLQRDGSYWFKDENE